MRNKLSFRHSIAKQQGLSLFELLVSLFISSIIMAGVVNTIVTTKQAYVFDEQVGYMQENARFAVDVITRDLRQAGYMGGCNINGASVANTVGSIGTAQEDFLKMIPVEGFQTGGYPSEFTADVWASTSTPDVIMIRYTDGNNNMTVVDHIPPTAAVIEVNTNHGYEDGKIVILTSTDCGQLGITAMTHDPSTDQIQHNSGNGGSSNNCTKKLWGNFDCSDTTPASYQAYPPGSSVLEFVANAYYIRASSADSTVPALFLEGINGTGAIEAAELVPGVEDLQILYGVDTQATNQDGKANKYLTAAEITNDEATAGTNWIGWDRVVSVRLQLVVRSRDRVLQQDTSQTPIVGGTTYNDRYMRQLISTTVQLRNAALAANI